MKEKRYSFTATCYDRRGRIIGYGENNYNKTHPLMNQINLRIGGNKKLRSQLHAEVLALLRCGDKKPWRIFVQRYTCAGTPSDAHPCPICMEAIRMWGVRYLEYTTKAGIIIKEKLK